MANLYGVANPQNTPTFQGGLLGGADIVTVAAAETNLITATLVQPDLSGVWYAIMFYTLVVSCGATPPGAGVIAIRVNAGADNNQQGVAAANLVANANITLSGCLVTAASKTLWQGAGATVQLTGNFSAQPVTVRNGGSGAVIALWRALDQ